VMSIDDYIICTRLSIVLVWRKASWCSII